MFWHPFHFVDFTHHLKKIKSLVDDGQIAEYFNISRGFQPLTIIIKRSILDVAAALDPPLISSPVGYEVKKRI